MTAILILLMSLPLAAALACLVLPVRASQALTLVVGVGCFGLCVALIPAVGHRDVSTLKYLRADALSLVFLLATAFLYAVTSMYTIGYLRREQSVEDFPRYARRLYVGLNLFAWSLDPSRTRDRQGGEEASVRPARRLRRVHAD